MNKLTKITKLCAFMFLTTTVLSTDLFAKLDVYTGIGIKQPGPKSPLFTVSVTQGKKTKKAHVYHDTNKRQREGSEQVKGDSISWIDFGQADKDTSKVSITRLDGKPFTFQPTIRPSSYNLNDSVKMSPDRKTVSFTVTGNKKMMSLEYHNSERDNNTKNALMIFASTLPEKINPKAKNVRYFGPGVHAIEDKQVYTLPKKIDTVYLARGAFVKGKINIQNTHKNVKVLGHGVLYGGEFDATKRNTKGQPANYAMVHSHSNGVEIKGITMVDATMYHIVTWERGNRNIIENVKCMSWMYNTDGIQSRKATITDSFLRCNDDSLRFFSSDIEVKRCVIWQLRNGSSFCCSWKWPKVRCENVYVEDCDVIHTEWDWMKYRPLESIGIGDNNGVFSLERLKDPIEMRHFKFSNIRIEGECARVFNIKIGPEGEGKIHDISFEDVTLTGTISKFNQITTAEKPNQTIENITFKNVRFQNETITKDNCESLGKFKFNGMVDKITWKE